MTSLIDERGVKALSGWYKQDERDIVHTITIIPDNFPLLLNIKNDSELATIKVILMKNGIKFIVDDINNISQN